MDLPKADQPLADVFSAFGYAAFYAFLWESQLAALALTVYGIDHPNASASDLDQFDSLMRAKRTCGQMLDGELRAFLDANQEFTAFFKTVTDHRNRLIHRFYEEHIPNLESEAGRALVVREISEITRVLKVGQKAVKSVYMELARNHCSNIDEALDRAREEADRLWNE